MTMPASHVEGARMPAPAAISLAGADPNVEPCSWSHNAGLRMIRRFGLEGFVLPFVRIFARIDSDGLEHLNEVHGPVIFAASHQSEFDTPVLLAALPAPWRDRTAVTMCDWQFGSATRWKRALLEIAYYWRVWIFNAFTLPRGAVG